VSPSRYTRQARAAINEMTQYIGTSVVSMKYFLLFLKYFKANKKNKKYKLFNYFL